MFEFLANAHFNALADSLSVRTGFRSVYQYTHPNTLGANPLLNQTLGKKFSKTSIGLFIPIVLDGSLFIK